MSSLAELDEIRQHPEPAYPEYPELLSEAGRSGRFVDPASLEANAAAINGRGPDWCTAVLGFPYPPSGIRGISSVEFEVLVAAHRRDLNPPLPARITAWRAEGAQHAAAAADRQAAARRHDRDLSDAAIRECSVPVERRPNTRRRRNNSELHDALVHLVPIVDAVSGRGRRHPAGRAACEREDRPKPRQLGEPTDAPLTCKSCLGYAPKIRTAEETAG